MSILFAKNPSAVQKLSKRERQAEVDARWMSRLTRPAIVSRLQQVRDDILGLDFVVKEAADVVAREALSAMFARLIDLAHQVDVTQATMGQQSEATHAVYDNLSSFLSSSIKPSVLTKSLHEVVEFHYFASGNLKDKLSRIYGVLSSIQDDQRDMEIEVIEVDEITASKLVQFPVVVNENKVVLSAVRSLQTMWERANTRHLTVADRFTVDAIATSYLPDSLRLLQNLSRYSVESKAESEKIFLQHVNLLQRQLEKIFQQDELNEISAMRAHTLFLESKLA